ncbi:hypothetical protein C6501_01145 [Candidatus Poribacteria bacterium]|nr:MAG: hypothetical protein C6501_01145 [Candidatus Poribacteria bacterium]
MSDHFNDLLLQTLKDVSIRLERLEGRADHVINEKADKIDVGDVKTELKSVKIELKTDVNDVKAELNDVKAELKSVNQKLDQKADKADLDSLRDEVRSNGQRLDRLEAGIKTLQWTVTAGVAALGVLIALLKAF